MATLREFLDKEDFDWDTGRIIPDKDEVFAATTKEWAVFIRRLEDMKDTHEIISFCIEPNEPCEWCDVNDGAWCATYDGRMIALDNEGSPETLLAENWSFCPNCGRRLK